MTEPARKVYTYEDILALDEKLHAELLDGMIYIDGVPLGSVVPTVGMAPAQLPRHAKSQRVLGKIIGGPFDDDHGDGGPGGWWIFIEVDVLLASGTVRPDLSGWRRERLPQPDVRPIATRPDWVCEIISPTSIRQDRVAKRRAYAKAGIPHYWIVDPDARTLEALELQSDRWLEVGTWSEGDVARIAPFEPVEVPVGRLFLPPETRPEG